MNNRGYKKRKPIIEIGFLLLVVIFVGFVTFNVTNKSTSLMQESRELKNEIKENDTFIQSNEMYQRMDQYGFKLSWVGNVLSYKDYMIKWDKFFIDLKELLPQELTVKSIQFSEVRNNFNISLIAPNENILLKSIEKLDGYKYLTINREEADFSTITRENINIDGERYNGYSTVLTIFVDEDYLYDNYMNVLDEEDLFEDLSKDDISNTGGLSSTEKESIEEFSPVYDF